jgi:hypothetical protein
MIKEREMGHTFIKHNISEGQVNRGDCVARSISRASSIPYYIVYEDIKNWCSRDPRRRGSPASGVAASGREFRSFMQEYGFQWFDTGHGFTIDEVPAIGRYVIPVPKHFTALCDGRLYDTFDPRKKSYRGRVTGGFWLWVGTKLSK